MAQSQITDRFSLHAGEYLSVSGFCPEPESQRFHFQSFDEGGFSVQQLKRRIYLESQDITRWSLASLNKVRTSSPISQKFELCEARNREHFQHANV